MKKTFVILLLVFLLVPVVQAKSLRTVVKITSKKVTIKKSTIKEVSPSLQYVCNCKKTCSQMSCAEAQYQLNVCGCTARDADHDGTACDTQCQ